MPYSSYTLLLRPSPKSWITISRERKEFHTGDPLLSKRKNFWGPFTQIVSLDFWIFDNILRTKRATGDPLLSKLPDFLGLFNYLCKPECSKGANDEVKSMLEVTPPRSRTWRTPTLPVYYCTLCLVRVDFWTKNHFIFPMFWGGIGLMIVVPAFFWALGL